MTKTLEEIALDIAHAQVCVDLIWSNLLNTTAAENISARKSITEQRGHAICALAYMEGYLSALRSGTLGSVITPAPTSGTGRPFSRQDNKRR